MVNEEEVGETSTNLSLASLPFHVVVDLHAGRTPQPVKFKAITVFSAGALLIFGGILQCEMCVY